MSSLIGISVISGVNEQLEMAAAYQRKYRKPQAKQS